MRRSLLLFLAIGLTAAACGRDATDPGSSSSSSVDSSQFAAQVATTDLYAGAAQRVDVGVFSSTTAGVRVSNNSIEVLAADVGHSSPDLPSPCADAPWPPPGKT